MTNLGAKASVFLGAICLVPLIGWGSPAVYAQDTMFTDGTACEITGGLNEGKIGIFTDSGTWCRGDWGATQCVNNNLCRAR
jgi:hypothetical protein